jgi:selenocysteine lyase/cysteine desulfurase
MDRLELPGVVRVSLGVYNDEVDIDRLVTAIEAVREMFR